MGRAMRGVSMDMDMGMGKTGERGRGMHMRRCLGGKGLLVAAMVVVVWSQKGRRKRDPGKGLVGKVYSGLSMGMISKYDYGTEEY